MSTWCSRDTTTVATQALYLLNDPFVKQQSQFLSERLLARSDLDRVGRVRLAYQLAFARPATSREVGRAEDYLAAYNEARATSLPRAQQAAARR